MVKRDLGTIAQLEFGVGGLQPLSERASEQDVFAGDPSVGAGAENGDFWLPSLGHLHPHLSDRSKQRKIGRKG